MNYRRYVYCFYTLILIFVLSHFLIWKCFTEKLFTAKHGDGGDLARLGYLPNYKLTRKSHIDLPRRHISLKEYTGQHIDILTVGDSFSNGGGSGKNGYYQDYIASINNMMVLNIGLFKQSEGFPPFLDPIQTLLLLINSGALERISPRTVIVSVSVKQAVMLMAKSIDFGISAPVNTLWDEKKYEYYKALPTESHTRQFSFISNGNFKYLYYLWCYKLFHKTNSMVVLANLNRKFFSVEGETLLYYSGDIEKITGSRMESFEQINSNLNKLAEILAKKGISLYFMPCVDKYDLYSPYILQNHHPRNDFFESFLVLSKKYTFIDTKEILSKMLLEGIIDVFYPDDSHWSWKASQRIFETVRFR